MSGANSRLPFLAGTSRLYKALSVCVASWNIRASSAAAAETLTAWITLVIQILTQEIVGRGHSVDITGQMEIKLALLRTEFGL